MTERLGDAPIELEYRDLMNKVAQGLDKVFNGEAKGKARKTGFVLLVFPYDDAGHVSDPRCNFISNGADRKDVVILMREMIARFEGQPEVTGHA